ncbi:MAG: PAS domain S-box protein, partial [Desulfopila sp.]|nr:PAS domain S-box protein [Desulfopila sp.]
MTQGYDYEVSGIFLDILSSTRDGIAFLDENYRYVVVNDAYEKMSGVSREAIIGLTVADYLGRETFEKFVKERFDRCLQGEAVTYQEWFDYPESGQRYMEVSYVPCRDREKRIIGVIANSRDITDRHYLADEQRVTLRLLQVLHEHADMQTLASKAVELIQEWSGCEAVGIRVERSGAVPYYETKGFPADFISTANRRGSSMHGDEIRSGQNGYAELECLCGQFTSACLGPDLPDSSENGSFWINNISDRPVSLQRACKKEGYRVIALIPLRDGNKSRGLLQMNDRRKTVFSPRDIAVLERLASYLALGFSQRVNRQILKENEQKYKGLVNNLPGTTYQFLLSASGEQRFTFIGGECEELFGLSAAEITADSSKVFAAVPPDDASRVQESIARSAETFCRYDVEHRIQHKEGRMQWIRAISTPRRLADGETVWDGIAINITQRKKAENELLQLNRDFQIREQTAKLFLTAPAERVFNDLLDVLLERFGAVFGYIGYINSNGDLVCPSMSREVWQKCRIPEKSIVFPRQKWGGIWGES